MQAKCWQSGEEKRVEAHGVVVWWTLYSTRRQTRRIASPDPIRLARMVNEIGS